MSPSACPAARLPEVDRKDLAILALARTATISNLAAQHNVSRKFDYQQAAVEESNCVTGFNACFPLDRGRKVTHLPARPRKQLCQLVASERKSVNSQL